ncbi:YncE family protein [Paraburkholderia sp. RL17-337-BIB-A]|uniref:YncE family protein n=1 Tax=Paraburkholderia sp. RL17-337-BIB-A TaxID=3031636 RepID=UPI0038B89B81
MTSFYFRQPARAVLVCVLWACGVTHSSAAAPQFILSSQDGKVMVINGDIKTVEGSDTVAVIKVTGHHAEIVTEFPVPNSVFGPPQSVDTTPDGRLAFVTAGAKRDPADPAKTSLDDLVSIVDLTEKPPRVIDTLHAGMGVGGISVSPDGKLAIAASRADGLPTGGWTQGLAFTPDGKTVLVQNTMQKQIEVIAINGDRAVDTGQRLQFDSAPSGMRTMHTAP